MKAGSEAGGVSLDPGSPALFLLEWNTDPQFHLIQIQETLLSY